MTAADIEEVGALLSSATVTGPLFRFVSCPVKYNNCVAAVYVLSLVAVGADSLMGDVVGSSGEPWVASLLDDF